MCCVWTTQRKSRMLWRTNHQHTHIQVLLALRQKVISGGILFFLFFSSSLLPLTGIQEMQSNLETVTWWEPELRGHVLQEELAYMGHLCSHSLCVLPVGTRLATASGWAEVALSPALYIQHWDRGPPGCCSMCLHPQQPDALRRKVWGKKPVGNF